MILDRFKMIIHHANAAIGLAIRPIEDNLEVRP
jgi:hypothetical protein